MPDRCPALPPAAVAVMMYGFGDDVSPLPETLDLVEDIVLDYAGTLMRKVGIKLQAVVLDYASTLMCKVNSCL